ncbi:MAG: class I SAM-dependent methyltransferase, partial [Vicinamibacterales bacterium]
VCTTQSTARAWRDATMDAADIRRESHDIPSTERQPRVNAASRWLATCLQRTLDAAAVRLELWDGSSPCEAGRQAIGDLVVRDQRTLLALVLNPDLSFGDAYRTGRVQIRGDLEEIVEALSRTASPQLSWRDRIAIASSNTLRAARRNVQHHYDLGNEFYRLWLDREMVYTSAYFPTPDASLEDAQRAKLDLVCRKLRLRPGERVVELGCGWGALALHMARAYGVRVRAFNVSQEQLGVARERAAREALASRVEFIDDDYRNVSGRFDVLVSVGMVEHVGLAHFRSLGDVVRRSLRRDGGRGLLHFIGRDAPRPLNAWIRRRIFPGAYTPTLAEVTGRILTPAGMSVLDVENLRLHYARTLAHWAQRFAAAREQVRAAYGVEFERTWELYLAGSQAAFATGWMQLFQVVFAPRESPPPWWTRASVYGRGEDP